MSDTKKYANIKALRGYRLNGKHVNKGDVVSKKDFSNKSDWLNICNMEPAKAEETNDKVGDAKADKAGKAKLPGT